MRGSRQYDGDRCLIMAHGAGSTAEFLARAFPAERCDAETVFIDDRTGSCAIVADRICAAVEELRPRYREVLVGGVSIGSHAAAMVSASLPVDGCVLAMPGWTGHAGPENPTSLAANDVAQLGAEVVLARLQVDTVLAGDWVAAELRRAWADRQTLGVELRRAADEPAPEEDVLRQIRVPALVLGLADDPFHPLAVARRWAEVIPRADLVILDRQAPAAGREAFGKAVGQWLASHVRTVEGKDLPDPRMA